MGKINDDFEIAADVSMGEIKQTVDYVRKERLSLDRYRNTKLKVVQGQVFKHVLL